MSKRPIYYDTETTGTRFNHDRIVEIAAYDPERKRSFQMLVNPEMPIPKDVTAIHGITDEMVSKAPTFAHVGRAFLEFCEGEVVLIAHNNDNFDKYFLLHESKRCQFDFPAWPMVDSLRWARKYRPDLPRHSLQFLRQIYGIAENKAHRALDDVMVLFQIFSIMIDDLSMERVLQLLEESETSNGTSPTFMPFGKHQGKALADVPTEYLKWLFDQKVFEKPENSALKAVLEKLGKLTFSK